MTLRERLRELPARVGALPTRRRRLAVLAAVVGYAAVLYGVVLAVQRVVGDDPVDWLQPLGPVVGSLVGTPLGLWLVARRLGGMERVGQLQTALRSRRLPDDADPAVWRPLLLGQRRLQQRIVIVTQVLLVAVGLAALVVTDVSTGVLLLGLAVLLLVAVLVGWASRRSQRPLDELIAGLPGPA